MNVENVHSSGHSPVSQIAAHILCTLSNTVCPPALNSSAGTSLGPVAFCDLLSDGWHEQSLNEVVEALAPNILVQFLFPSSSWYKSSQYPFHLSAICAVSVNFSPVGCIADVWLKLSSHWFEYLKDLPGISVWVRCFQFHACLPAAAVYPL